MGDLGAKAAERKKRTEKAIRKCIRKQLGYIKRDLGYIIGFIRDKGAKLDQAVIRSAERSDNTL